MKECQYCSDKANYCVPVPWLHHYITQNKKGEETVHAETREMMLHLCQYHWDIWRLQNVSDM